MSYVIAIDVGVKNLGLCIFDFTSCQVVLWKVVNLAPSGKYIPCKNVEYVRTLVDKYEHYFAHAQKVVIERQIRCNMRIIEAVITALYYERCIPISARSVKLHYGLSTRNYRQNKQAAVEWVTDFVRNNAAVFLPGSLLEFETKKKQDDLADSLLLLLYYLDTYSNYLDREYVFF